MRWYLGRLKGQLGGAGIEITIRFLQRDLEDPFVLV